MQIVTQKIKQFLKKSSFFQTKATYHLASLRYAPDMASIVWEAKKALENGVEPEKVTMASTPVYLLRDVEKEPLCIFKISRMIENSFREFATYVLDHKRFAGVPPTALATFHHPIWGGDAFGSCQLYVQESTPLVHMHPHTYEKLREDEVRKVACLDIRLLNIDRHSSNLLIKDLHLIPIDHAIALPSHFSGAQFEWLHWPQTHTPFSEEEKEYILQLDSEADRNFLLNEIRVHESSANLFYMASELLKQGTIHHLSAYQIALLMLRVPKKEGDSSHYLPSPFEEAEERARKKALFGWQIYKMAIHEEVLKLVNYATCSPHYQKTRR